MDPSPAPVRMMVKDPSSMPWDELISGHTGQTMLEKKLLRDADTGMMINYVHFPEGYLTPWHRHDCAHGIYVLEGTLYTNEGSYGPGSFVWFAEGCVAEHGTRTEGGVTVLFITNKVFNITFVEPPGQAE